MFDAQARNARAVFTHKSAGRVGEMAELTNLAAYLISDAAGYINGEVITIDGGEWISGAVEFNRLSELTSEEWDEIATLTRGEERRMNVTQTFES